MLHLGQSILLKTILKMQRKILLFLVIIVIVQSVSARTCREKAINFFPASGSELGDEELILIDLYGLYVYFHDTISNTRIYAVTEFGKRDEVKIIDTRKGGYNFSQLLIKLTFQDIEPNEVFHLQIDGLPNISFKKMTESLIKDFERAEWTVIEKDEDQIAPVIPSGIRYEYYSSWADHGEYRINGTLSFIENGVHYTYSTPKESIPNMLLRVQSENGFYVYLPVIEGGFNWHQGYCSSYFPEVVLGRNQEFRARLLDMSGNQLESQNKLILF